jgi:tetratricopeptide (TPR) repeat protein
MQANRRIFLSAASSEYKDQRLALDATLRRANFDCELQEIFPQTASDTVRKLSDLIKRSTLLIHIVGHLPGSVADERAVIDLLSDIPPDQFLAHEPKLRKALGDLSGITYTQWEAFLALHHRVPFLLYAPADALLAGSPSATFAQKLHLERLLIVNRYAEPCLDREGFLTAIPAAVYNHFGVSAPAEKPRLLPYPTLGKLFKGREDTMEQLRAELASKTPTVIRGAQAIHGLGGVGKTRTAVEFAYANEQHYSAVLFVTADTPDALQRNLAGLCGPLVLDLPEQNATETAVQVHAVIHWLRQHPGWFLIIDNVDSAESKAAVTALLRQIPDGHVLITSRLDRWPTGFTSLELDVLDIPNSIRLLLDHTEGKRQSTPEDEALAGKIAEHLGGLCLALEQAAAYVRHNACGLARYLEAWGTSSVTLHQQYSDRGIDDYHAEMSVPRSLVVTYETSLSQIPAPAQELFRILSWLAPDALPLRHLENLRDLPDARSHLIALTDLHLATLNPAEQTFSVHRLLQEISRQQQPEPQPPALLIALKWINGEMPNGTDDVRTWPIAIPLAPHAVVVAQFAAAREIPAPTARLLDRTATLFQYQGNYTAAEPLFRQILKLSESANGKEDTLTATYLNNLATLLQATNRHTEAEPLMRRALAIDEASFGPDHPDVAIDLNNLAQLLKATNRLTEAEEPMKRVAEIFERALGKDHPNVATALNNLAQLLQDTNRLTEAEPLMRRALAIDETSFGPDHPKVAIRLNNLAQLLKATNRLTEAEPLMRRALAIDEASFGPDHPDVARDLNNLGRLLQATNRHTEAEPLMRRALAIDEASFGPDHPDVARDLNNLALLLQDTNRLTEAEPLMRRAAKIFEDSLGPEHPKSVIGRENLEALLKEMQG